MYLPHKQMSQNHIKNKKQRSRLNRYSVVVALLLLIATAGWAIWQAQHEEEIPTSLLKLNHDLSQLWTWSDAVFKNGAAASDWSIRWDFTTGQSKAIEAMSATLFTDKQGLALEKLVTNEGRTISGSLPSYGAFVSISLIETSNVGESLMVLLERKGNADQPASKLLEAVSLVSSAIVSYSPEFTSSMKAQGYTDNGRAIDDLIIQSLAKRIESYNDENTISELVYTNQLHSYIYSSEGRMGNMQVSVHRSTEQKGAELTIGVPLITGDYSLR